MEKAFFNAGPAPVTRDFKMLCYFQSPNRMGAGCLPDNPPIGGPPDIVFTPYGAPTLCCAGNVNNTIPDYIQNMCMESLDGGLAFVLYGPCRIEKVIKDKRLNIRCRTEYPFNDRISIRVGSSGKVTMPFYLRIPGWCTDYSVKVNGKRIREKSKDGFIKVFRTWQDGDRIDLVFPMQAKVTAGRKAPYPKVKYFSTTPPAADRNVDNPFEYVTYGPLLYVRDINANRKDPESRYNYALDVSPGKEKSGVKVVKASMKSGTWNWGLEDAPVKLMVRARELDWYPTKMQPLSKEAVKGVETVQYNWYLMDVRSSG
ncbi:MAG: glycoside hydrolase family 127 protein, partial [Prevotella sp.]|jgi:hypothetical protein|nr:glycoside hydrolase family 127 protein [Prevotella sp.]